MPFYKTKPKTVQAEQLTWNNWGKVCDLVSADQFAGGLWIHPTDDSIQSTQPLLDCSPAHQRIGLKIKTGLSSFDISKVFEVSIAIQDDWIVKDENGRCSICKPEQFEKLYQSVA